MIALAKGARIAQAPVPITQMINTTRPAITYRSGESREGEFFKLRSSHCLWRVK